MPLFAVIHHDKAYKEQMMGRHGQQLSLTEIDARGKDDAKYDPFAEYEIKPLKDESMFMAEYRDKEENDDDDDNKSNDEDNDDSDEDDSFLWVHACLACVVVFRVDFLKHILVPFKVLADF